LGFVEPSLATLRDEVPSRGSWIYEIKKKEGRPEVYTRSGLDWTRDFGWLTDQLSMLPARELILDGEVVALEENGRSNFSKLQANLKSGRSTSLAYYAFDLLFFDGFDLRGAALVERKKILKALLDEAAQKSIIFSDHFETGGQRMFTHACKLGLEGIICKQPDRPYRPGRREDWIKIKCVQQEVFPIVGFIKQATGVIGAVRLARKNGKELHYVGKAGTGFNRKNSHDLIARLSKFARPTPPITERLRKKDTTWVEPKLSAIIEYRDITDDGKLRHASFKGLKSDPRRRS
jgi:bifunctional non-homologous end joining protein LigD